jgi:hypothetical protein
VKASQTPGAERLGGALPAAGKAGPPPPRAVGHGPPAGHGVTPAGDASPPCQGEGAPTKGTNRARNERLGRSHPRLIGPTREALEATGRPYVIENVAGSSVRKDLRLCGTQFGLPLLMHRYFEFGGGAPTPPMLPHDHRHGGHRVRGWRHGSYFDGPYIAAYGKGGGKATAREMQAAKRIDWTDDHMALREALPPAYTEFIGRALMAHLKARAA